MNPSIEACYQELSECRLHLERIYARLRFIQQSQREITPPEGECAKRIKLIVADDFDMEPQELDRRTRQQRIVWPRAVAIYFMRHYTTLTLNQVSSFFPMDPLMDHGTILHAQQKVEGLLEIKEKHTTTLIERLKGPVEAMFQPLKPQNSGNEIAA